MFRLAKPKPEEIRCKVEDASRLEFRPAEFLASKAGLKSGVLPSGFEHDQFRTSIGDGEATFETALHGFEQWMHFDLGWVRVANPGTRIEVGQVVTVEVRSLGLWSLNLSRIVEVIRESGTFGFIYKTTRHHLEEGEERFLLTLEAESDTVWYELEAVSRPRVLLARLGFPLTRAFQRRFARDSHRRMREVVASSVARP